MFRLLIVICASISISGNLYGQCNFKNKVFLPGESVSYSIYYKLGVFWFNAAEVNFKVKSSYYQGEKVFHFDSYGQTLPNYDWIFKVRDHYQSYSDTIALKSLYFSRVTHEGNYNVNNSYIFNYNDNKIYSTIENTDSPKHKDTLKMQECTFDMLTAIYACRNINVNQLQFNDTIPLKMLVDNQIYNLYLRFLGFETIQLKDMSKYRCSKFTILMVKGTIFSGGEDISIWISDDNAKIPIKVEAKILVGSIIAFVDKIKGNKWPLSSQIIE